MSDEKKLPEGAIGHRNSMDEDALAGKHIDGETGFVFETEDAYLAFKHPESG
jgi:hypothetical protein